MVNEKGQFVYSPFSPPVDYDPPVLYEKMIQERDVMVTMRDGGKVCVDVYRPDTKEKVSAILSFAPHFKDWQSPNRPCCYIKFLIDVSKVGLNDTTRYGAFGWEGNEPIDRPGFPAEGDSEAVCSYIGKSSD